MKNETGRSVHQATQDLESAVAALLTRFDALAKGKTDKEKQWERVSLSDASGAIRKLRAAYLAHLEQAPKVPRKDYEISSKPDLRSVEVTEKHESYGLIQLNRVTGGARLFGSVVKHQYFFQLAVLRAQRIVGSAGERYYSDGRVPIVKVSLSAAQFVDLITTQNIGEGVPCTIESVEGVDMDDVPESVGGEIEVMQKIFAEDIATVVSGLSTLKNDLASILSAKTLTKAGKQQIEEVVGNAHRILTDSAPFVLSMFHEHSEKIVAKGKMEIEAFITTALNRAGVKAVRDAGGTLLLGSGEDDTNPKKALTKRE